MFTGTCLVETCQLEPFSGDYCRGHYRKWKRYGDPLVGRSITGEWMPIFLRMASEDSEDCLLWPGLKNRQGYGELSSLKNRMGLSTALVHRAALILRCGPPPFERAEAAHSPRVCHNPSCMNYRHLYWATRADNLADMEADGTRRRAELAPNAKLRKQDVVEIRDLIREGEMSQAAIGRRFGVSQGVISHIHRSQSYFGA